MQWEMSRSIIAAVANLCLFVLCVSGPTVASVSRSIIAAYAGFMLCFVCISLCVFEPARVQLGVGNVPLYHCGHCRLYVMFCLCFLVCIWACARAVGGVKCPALSLRPLPTLYLFVLCVSGPARMHRCPALSMQPLLTLFIFICFVCAHAAAYHCEFRLFVLCILREPWVSLPSTVPL